MTFRKLLYFWAFTFAARIAPKDVRSVHSEIFNLGINAYEEAHAVAEDDEMAMTMDEIAKEYAGLAERKSVLADYADSGPGGAMEIAWINTRMGELWPAWAEAQGHAWGRHE